MGVESFKAKFGGNIRESMGAAPAGGYGHVPIVAGPPSRYAGVGRPKEALTLPVAQLHPDPDQPRKEFDPEALQDLADSLKARGQLQPIRVRWDEPTSRWVIIAGERRWQAAKMAGIEALTCIEAKAAATAEDILEDQLVENCVRADLKPIEQAEAFRALMERKGYSARQLAKVLSISHTSVNRAMDLLGLAEPVQALVESGEIAPSMAAEISKAKTAEAQIDLAGQVASGVMNFAGVAEAVRSKPGKVGPRGQGGASGKAKPGKSRTFRVARGRVIVEGRRLADAPFLLEMLEEAVRQFKAEGEAEAA